MQIREATINDLAQIIKLFTETISAVNSKDYTSEQTAAWSSRGTDITKWTGKINEQYFIVSEDKDTINGFASLTTSGYLDFMFVHKNYQGKGIASMLLKSLENKAHELNIHEIISDVSITAKPFFLGKGFTLIKEQTVDINGVELTNFKMQKEI